MNGVLFLDTEFNGFGGELLSLALVGVDGKEFYVELELPTGEDIHPWVSEHVLPQMIGLPLPRNAASAQMQRFLRQYSSVEVIADWPADFVYFFDMMMHDSYEKTLMMPVKTFLAAPPSEPVPEQPHNALSDARALRAAWVETKN